MYLPAPCTAHARPTDPLRSAKPTVNTRTLSHAGSHGPVARSAKPKPTRARPAAAERTAAAGPGYGHLHYLRSRSGPGAEAHGAHLRKRCGTTILDRPVARVARHAVVAHTGWALWP
jgi:hypothetical protein